MYAYDQSPMFQGSMIRQDGVAVHGAFVDEQQWPVDLATLSSRKQLTLGSTNENSITMQHVAVKGRCANVRGPALRST